MVGLDREMVETLDWNRAVGRIRSDISTDFLVAPAYSAIYEYCAEALIDRARSLLTSGTYSPGLPTMIDVPKKSGLTRPGAVPAPVDRLVYQAVIDQLADKLEPGIDKSRVFSNRILVSDPRHKMFVHSSVCYKRFQSALADVCSKRSTKVVVKTDVACYFERLYQHRLINLLHGYGADTRCVNLLESVLKAFTQTDSHGIIQGVFPSDFLGNFALTWFDTDMSVRKVPSIRFVDDLYTFHKSETAARRNLVDICSILRSQGLHLNEAKTRIVEADEAVHEETEIDRRFELAKQEVRTALTRHEVYEEEDEDDYGFQLTWVEDIAPSEATVELKAMRDLYELVEEEDVEPEKIERFCLPHLGRARDSIAVSRALSGIIERPHMARIYCAYLKYFVGEDPHLRKRLLRVLVDDKVASDWVLAWPLFVLLGLPNADNTTLETAIRLLRDRNRHEGVRALAACLVGKHGAGAQRTILRDEYARSDSEYVRCALLYAARYFPADERRACIGAWSGHSTTNSLVAKAIRVAVAKT